MDGSDPRQPASAKRKLHLSGAQPDGRLARLHRLVPGLLVETLDDRPDLGAADADIGKRVIVERHQLVIGALAIPGVGPFIAAGPIMGALAGAGVGGAVGGLVGSSGGNVIESFSTGDVTGGVDRLSG